MSKFCPNCGEELIDIAVFCGKCGTKLEGSDKVRESILGNAVSSLKQAGEKLESAADAAKSGINGAFSEENKQKAADTLHHIQENFKETTSTVLKEANLDSPEDKRFVKLAVGLVVLLVVLCGYMRFLSPTGKAARLVDSYCSALQDAVKRNTLDAPLLKCYINQSPQNYKRSEPLSDKEKQEIKRNINRELLRGAKKIKDYDIVSLSVDSAAVVFDMDNGKKETVVVHLSEWGGEYSVRRIENFDIIDRLFNEAFGK